MIPYIENLFSRDIDRFIITLKKFPSQKLWKTQGMAANSAGVLAQHVAGNLHHYIGVGMGQSEYKRNREREFIDTGVDKPTLIRQLKEAGKVIKTTLSEMTGKQLQEVVKVDFPCQLNNYELLIHLYGHLNYHLGQLDYLYRLQDKL